MTLLSRKQQQKQSGAIGWLTGAIAVGSAVIGFVAGSFDTYDAIVTRFFPSAPKIDEDYFVYKITDWDAPTWRDEFLGEFKSQFSGYSITIPEWVTGELSQRTAVVAATCEGWTPDSSTAEEKRSFLDFCKSQLRATPLLGTYAIRNAEDNSISGVTLKFNSIKIKDTDFIDMYDGFHTFQASKDEKCIVEFELENCRYDIASITPETHEVGTLLPSEGMVIPLYVAWRLTFPSTLEVPEGEKFGAEGLYDTLSRGPLRLPASVSVDGHQVLKSRSMYKSPTIELGFFDGRG